MKSMLVYTILLSSVTALAESGPTRVGSVSIGMSKAEYLAAVEIKPVNCNTAKSGGKPMRSEL